MYSFSQFPTTAYTWVVEGTAGFLRPQITNTDGGDREVNNWVWREGQKSIYTFLQQS